MSTAPWLTILGIGEDGVDGLSAAARAALSAAGLVVGGARHLARAEPLLRGDRMAWPSPLLEALPGLIARRRGQRTVVLASGDPLWFGIGGAILRLLPAAEVTCLPAPSCFSLACAQLGWSLQEVATLSLCGRPLALLVPALQPGARLLVLCADAATPAAVAGLLRARGFGASLLHVLQALGGARARAVSLRADETLPDYIDPLCMLAIALRAAPDATVLPLASGLDDALFEHDGQFTRREIRALTLSALAPRQGELLWDIGCGAGSIAIEWMLRHPANRALGIERDAARVTRAARNAEALGVPGLALRHGAAPAILEGLQPAPDAIFIGGGLTVPGLLEAALAAGGRLVANAVTIEAEAVLLAAQAAHGGSLTRIGIDRLDQVGGSALHALRPAMRITQWCRRR